MKSFYLKANSNRGITNEKKIPNEGNILSIMGSNIVNSGQRLKRDKTQIMLLQNNNGILPQINNITNINIHIYQNMHNNHNLNNSVSYNKNKKLK